MNSIYWNLRGFANTHTRLAFKKLCKFHKPDFFFIAEPWMNLDALPPRFFLNLNYKIFSFNNRDDNLPNLWGLCSVHLNHTVIISSDQHIYLISGTKEMIVMVLLRFMLLPFTLPGEGFGSLLLKNKEGTIFPGILWGISILF
jgi:hypothetical protein